MYLSNQRSDFMNSINGISEFDKLSLDEQTQLVNWCETNLVKVKNISTYRSSYGLKHDFEHSPGGFYITNGAFKGAMIKAGFNYKDYTDSPNWHFNVSKGSIRKIRESNELI